MTAFVLALLASLAVIGCSADNPPSLGGQSDASAGGDASDASPSEISVPATIGSWQATVGLEVTGHGSGMLGAISLSHGVGTITFAGAPARAFFAFSSAVPPGLDAGVDGGFADDVDVQILAEQEGRLIAAWLTCYQGVLGFVYYESTDGIASTASQSASGTCTLGASVSETPAWPSFAFPFPSLVPGFTIAGANIAYDGVSPGTIAFGGRTRSLHPFHVIDCSACDSPGWYELHAILWDAARSEACFGILYLEQSAPTSVELAYLTCLPSVTSPIVADQLFFSATWTHS